MQETKQTLTLQQVADLVGVTRKTLMAWVRTDRFPGPLGIGGGRKKLLWSARVVEAVLLGQRDAGEKPERRYTK